MNKLTEKSCVAYSSDDEPLNKQLSLNLIKQLDEWEISEDGKWIQHEFRFKNYYKTIAFVNTLAWVAHQQDHHPDIEVAYNRCLVKFSTHAVGGLSENDFICAAKIDSLFSNP